MSEKLYARRDMRELDKAGNYYCKHIPAMTGESLHSKVDIAAELGYRDMIIDTLKMQLKGRALDGTLIPAEPTK